MSNIPNDIKKMWQEAANLKEGMMKAKPMARKLELERPREEPRLDPRERGESSSERYARKYGTNSPSTAAQHAKIRETESRPENLHKDGGVARFPRKD